MKNLDAYMKNLYISLEDIDEELKDKIKNLEGYQITECCGCCCDGECGCDCTCDKAVCCEPDSGISGLGITNPIIANQFGRFNNETEVTRELDTLPKVTTLYDIHSQFDRFNFVQDVKRGHIEPLYFGHKNYSLNGSEVIIRQNGDMPQREANPESIEQLYDVATNQNKKIYKSVKDIVDSFDFKCPVVQTKINGEVQVYVIKTTGTNGKEGSIKSSLEEVAKILGKLDTRAEIKWSQVLDVAIDNIDDLYTFVITFVFNSDKVRETIKAEPIK